MKRYIVHLIIIIITLFGLKYSDDLRQVNSEELFLTDNSLIEYKQYKKLFPGNPLTIVSIPNKSSHQFLNNNFCQETSDCHLIGGADFPSFAKSFIKLNGINNSAYLYFSQKPHNYFIEKVMEIPEAKIAGTPFTNFMLDFYSENIKKIVFPSLFLIIFAFLFILTKSIKATFHIFIPSLSSASISLLFLKVVETQTNLIISIIPIMLFIINLTLSLHLYYTAQVTLSFPMAIKEKLKPIILMILTTGIGFSSLYFSPIRVIELFGIYTALLIILTSCLTLIWFYSSTKKSQFTKSKTLQIPFINFWCHTINNKKIIVLTLFSIFCGCFSFYKIPIITDATLYFPKKDKIREHIQYISENIIGTPIIDIVINTKDNDDISLEVLKKLQSYEQALETKVSKVSFLSLNKLVNFANNEYTKNNSLPNHIISYMTLRAQLPMAFQEIFTTDHGYKIVGFARPTNIDEYKGIVAQIKSIPLPSGMNLSFNGIYYHLMLAQEGMIKTLFKSFLLSLFIISFLSIFFFKKLKIFFIFSFVNTIPVLLSFIILWALDLSFNIATVMTYSISLGLIVDGSFHIIHGLDNGNKDYYKTTIVKPIISGSVLLALSFFSFSLIGFLPIREFGVCLGIIILLGMYFDLKILPKLWS